MSQTSLNETADSASPSSHPNDMHRGESGDQATSDMLQSPPPSRRVLDNLKDFTYDVGQSRDPLDTWPGQVEMRPRRRSTLLSSLIRGNQPHRSFFGEDEESEPTTAVKNQVCNPLNNARRLSKTAVSALKEKVPLPPLPWKQKRSLSQSANSRARAYWCYMYLPAFGPTHSLPHPLLSLLDAVIAASSQTLSR